jgi:hypothetical protein
MVLSGGRWAIARKITTRDFEFFYLGDCNQSP